LVIEGLSRYFGALSAVNGISLELAAQERRAIIGPNGAGKTTLFNLVTGHLAPSAGRILFEGTAITGLPPHAVARRGISRSFQRTNLFLKLSVLENLRLAAAARSRGSYNLLGSVERLRDPLERRARLPGRSGSRIASGTRPESCRTASSASSRSGWLWRLRRNSCCWTSRRRGCRRRKPSG
jgi:branched-chain amino acid transport system ATP-binding protein